MKNATDFATINDFVKYYHVQYLFYLVIPLSDQYPKVFFRPNKKKGVVPVTNSLRGRVGRHFFKFLVIFLILIWEFSWSKNKEFEYCS
jgi:hypothetical protein